ncbi:hypothetical protein EGW08_011382, partial [Elysia chlorotica]
CIQHDIFCSSLNILIPTCQPCDCVVMSDFLPLVAGWRLRYLGISGISLAAVNDDILWVHTLFQHALLGVVTATTEQTWRLNLKVTDFLFVVINRAKAINLDNLLVLLLYVLF